MANDKFIKQIKKFAKLSAKTAEKDTRKIALVGLGTVMKMSRVDEGTFRGNWNTAINSVDNSIDKDVKDSANQGQVDQRAFDKGSVEISKFKNGDDINVSNNMPYSGKLNMEDGYISVGLKTMERAAKQLRGKV